MLMYYLWLCLGEAKGKLFHSQTVLKLTNTEISLLKRDFYSKTTKGIVKIQGNLTE